MTFFYCTFFNVFFDLGSHKFKIILFTFRVNERMNIVVSVLFFQVYNKIQIFEQIKLFITKNY